MPLPVKPSSKPQWTDPSPGNRSEPDGSLKNSGWGQNDRPPYQFFNWLIWIIGTSWLNYFEAITDYLAGIPSGVDFTIGSAGTFADINAAMASTDVQPGAVLLILNSISLAATQIINKGNLEIRLKPHVVLSDGGAATGIQVSAAGVRVKGGKMSGFSTAAMLIDSGSNYTMISEMRLASNAADITDNNNKTATWGLINE